MRFIKLRIALSTSLNLLPKNFAYLNFSFPSYSEYPKFQQLQAEETARIFDSKLTSQILQLIPKMSDRLKKGTKVLDIGCGRGHAVNLMGKAFSNSKFTGCDISREGISAAKEEAEKMGLTNVRFEVKDALLIEEIGNFDIIQLSILFMTRCSPQRS